MKRSDFRHTERLRVRWAEIDAQQIVFNAHYLMYFDTTMAGYWRAMALDYAPSLAALGGDLFVRKATVEYLGAARYDDLLDIGLRFDGVGTSSMRFRGAVFRRDELLASCELVYVFADPGSRRALPVPTALRETFEAFETGLPMVEVRVGDWAELGAPASALRTAVFVEEQKVPAAMEWDEADTTCVHALAVNRLGMPLATGRLLQHAPGVARIGRMAVSSAMRGSGVGRLVLDALLAQARRRGDHEAVLSAQVSAASFYRRAGFAEHGAVFESAGIAHVEMTRTL